MITVFDDFYTQSVFNKPHLQTRLTSLHSDFQGIWLAGDASPEDETEAATELNDLLRELEDFLLEARHAGCRELVQSAIALQEQVRNSPFYRNGRVTRPMFANTSYQLAGLLAHRPVHAPQALPGC